MSEFNWTPDELQKIVEENSVVLFMKGTPEAPQCGFSNRAASVVSQLGVPFASVNVLSDARARNALRDWSGFPDHATIVHWWQVDRRFRYRA